MGDVGVKTIYIAYGRDDGIPYEVTDPDIASWPVEDQMLVRIVMVGYDHKIQAYHGPDHGGWADVD